MNDNPGVEKIAYDDEVAGFRQPMVTSIGIILGFQLTLLANWAFSATAVPAVSGLGDTVLAFTFLASIALFTVALYRLLDNRVRTATGRRYRTTLKLYLLAILLTLIGLAVALFV